MIRFIVIYRYTSEKRVQNYALTGQRKNIPENFVFPPGWSSFKVRIAGRFSLFFNRKS